jgi:hypothetical protein
MKQSTRCGRLPELTGLDRSADELERLARIDALLRVVAAHDRAEAQSSLRDEGTHPSLRLVTRAPAAPGSTRPRCDEQTHDLKLTFRELALISKSLQAVKTLGALPPQDELLNDTIQLVDLALTRAV